MMAKLAQKEIGTRPFFCPLHMQPVLKRMGFFSNEYYPVAERLYERGFYIPSGLALRPEQMERVAAEVIHAISDMNSDL